jgi:hypothetical protein
MRTEAKWHFLKAKQKQLTEANFKLDREYGTSVKKLAPAASLWLLIASHYWPKYVPQSNSLLNAIFNYPCVF